MLEFLKKNLVMQGDTDDEYLLKLLAASVNYAESYQHVGAGYYITHPMSPSTMQAVVMYATHLYESRDGSTGGFFADSPGAADQVIKSVNNLLLCGKEWVV